MAASLIPGTTVLKIAACEPHIIDLIKFLNKLGAKITSEEHHTYKIIGRKNLKGANHKIIPDNIEAGTFLIAALATGGNVLVKNINSKN